MKRVGCITYECIIPPDQIVEVSPARAVYLDRGSAIDFSVREPVIQGAKSAYPRCGEQNGGDMVIEIENAALAVAQIWVANMMQMPPTNEPFPISVFAREVIKNEVRFDPGPFPVFAVVNRGNAPAMFRAWIYCTFLVH